VARKQPIFVGSGGGRRSILADWHTLRGGGLAGNRFGVGALRAEAGIKR
jgi:hypothetical protein